MREFLLVILTAVVVTFLLVPLVRKLAVTFGVQAPVRDRDVHAIPTPRMGGLAMFGGMAAALLVAAHLPKMREIFQESNPGRALLLAGGLIVLIGIADDKWDIDALTKFAGQVAASGLLIMNGVQLYQVPLWNGEALVLGPEYGVPLTVFMVVASINAVNFIDGLDGLAAGVTGIAGAALFFYAYLLAGVFKVTLLTGAALIAALLVGVCAGFLIHNFHPARIFMGDTGSMLIGLLLAAATIQLTGQFDPYLLKNYDFIPIWLPLVLVPLVVLVPFLDMLLVVWRRTNDGRSPFAPDKLHLHHRLLKLGHSHRRAVLIMYAWVGLLALSMVAMTQVRPNSPRWALAVAGITVMVAIVGAALMVGIPRLVRPARADDGEPNIGEEPSERPRLHV